MAVSATVHPFRECLPFERRTLPRDLPLAGWLLLSAEGKQIPFFGLQLPPLIAESKTVAEWAKEVHETGGTVGYFLIGLHVAAALFHHYFVRDNTLRRMLPSRD